MFNSGTFKYGRMCAFVVIGTMLAASAIAQEASVHPGINKNFENADVQKYLERFEREGRVVFDRRDEIVAALDLSPGDSVADIGAGTGFFSFLMTDAVGPEGTVYAVDIAKNFIDYMDGKAQEYGLKNVVTIHNDPRSTGLEPDSVDAVFICDTYHHFEYPFDMLASIRDAMKDDGVLVIVDFERIAGETREFVWNMVRAGKGHFTDEIIDAGFELIEEVPFTEKHYILRFKKREMPEPKEDE